jgi:AcrR family transcriptional regulator
MTTKMAPRAETSKEKLIQSAERLFAEHGFDGTSVRDIANLAKVNSALVAYYFGSKEGLLAEVYTRHCEPLKRERARLLTELCPTGTTPLLENVLDAFIRPSLQAEQGLVEGKSFSRLRAMLSAENSMLLEQLVAQNFDESNRLFVNTLSKCLPDLSKEDIFWRFHFLLGTIYYTATGPHRIRTLSKGKCDPTDPVASRAELIQFAAAGFRAYPVPTRSKPVTKKSSKSSMKTTRHPIPNLKTRLPR